MSTAAPTTPAPIADPIALDAKAAAKLLGIGLTHFYSLLKTGRIGPTPRRLGKSTRFARSELVEWFNCGCPSRARWQAIQPAARREPRAIAR